MPEPFVYKNIERILTSVILNIDRILTWLCCYKSIQHKSEGLVPDSQLYSSDLYVYPQAGTSKSLLL